MSKLQQIVDTYLIEHKNEWIKIGETLQRCPELGYREEKTSTYIRQYLQACQIRPVTGLAITGIRGELKGKNTDRKLAILAELDALYCPQHPLADPITGAAHACGHHMQATAMLAVCRAFEQTGVMEHLGGNLVFLAIPSEELQSPEFLLDLQNKGLIDGGSGKQEFLKKGVFDDIDAGISVHALINDACCQDDALGSPSCNGFHTVEAVFKGKSAHAAMSPYLGINALNAAVLAIQGIQAQRENFAEKDYIRVSYNLTEGGTGLGSVPERAVLRLQVRAKEPHVLKRVTDKIKIACNSAAQTVGCELEVKDVPGYAPYVSSDLLMEIYEQQASLVLNKPIKRRSHGLYSSDLGDVSMKIPVAQMVVGGFSGTLHGADFCVENPESAYVLPARIIAATAISLLENEATRLLQVTAQYNKQMGVWSDENIGNKR